MKNEQLSVKKEIANFILTIIMPVAIIVLWQVSTTRGFVRNSVLPTPLNVWESAVSLKDKGLLQADITASLTRIVKGFVFGSVIGIIVGSLIGIFPAFDRFTKVFVAVFKPIPIISLIPVFILWLGIGEESKVAVITIGTFWALLVNTMDGIKSVDKKLLELSLILGKSRWETIRYIIFPYAFPSIYTGLRIAITSSIGYVITAEMIAASAGVGYRIMYARNMALPGIMFVGIIEIGLFGLIVDLLILELQKKLFSYR